MAKKGKIVQLPRSPENYIRTRARRLPLGDCYINDNWEDGGIAIILVTRKHVNGCITFGVFHVDLWCLGVKDTYYEYNMSDIDFKEFFEELKENSVDFDFIKADYVLIHNIIYGAIEFAEDYGFKPHKDFNITKYILKEDDENIELIDIEFGRNGKPFLIDTGSKHTKGALAQLEKTAGKGNYDFIQGLSNDEFDSDEVFDLDDEYDDDEDERDEEDEFDKPFEEWSEDDLREIAEGKKQLSLGRSFEMFAALYLSIASKKERKKVDAILDEIDRWNVDPEAVDDFVPDISDELKEKLGILMQKTEESPENALPQIESALQKHPETTILYSLKGLCQSKLEMTDEMVETAEKMYIMLPDNVGTFNNYIHNLYEAGRNETANTLIAGKTSLPARFPIHKKFTVFEYVSFVHAMVIYFLKNDKLLEAIAYALSLLNWELNDICTQQSEFVFLRVSEAIMNSVKINKESL